MTTQPPAMPNAPRRPAVSAALAALAARIVGVLLMLAGVALFASSASTMSSTMTHTDFSTTVPTVTQIPVDYGGGGSGGFGMSICAAPFYVAPSLAVLALAWPVRRGSKAATIALAIAAALLALPLIGFSLFALLFIVHGGALLSAGGAVMVGLLLVGIACAATAVLALFTLAAPRALSPAA